MVASAGGDETPDSSSYCPNCGGTVESDDSYCGQCGHDLSENVTRTGGNVEQFRARVRDHVNDGWEVQYDAGDEVSLVDRSYGSVPVHIILVLFTGGIGNLIYGWYHYEHNSKQKVLRADGQGTVASRGGTSRSRQSNQYAQQRTTSQSSQHAQQHATNQAGQPSQHRVQQVETEDSSLSSYFWGLVLVVFAVAVLASSWTSAVGLTIAFASLFLASLVFPPTRRRIDNRHPPTTFGPTTTVDEEFVSDTSKPCSVCFDQIDQGVRRDYKQSYVFAGLPLYTMERGENWYCEECRQVEMNAGEVETVDSNLTTETDVDPERQGDASLDEELAGERVPTAESSVRERSADESPPATEDGSRTATDDGTSQTAPTDDGSPADESPRTDDDSALSDEESELPREQSIEGGSTLSEEEMAEAEKEALEDDSER